MGPLNSEQITLPKIDNLSHIYKAVHFQHCQQDGQSTVNRKNSFCSPMEWEHIHYKIEIGIYGQL